MAGDSKQAGDVKSLNLYQKLAGITGEIGIIAKDGKNSEQNFMFIEYAAIAGRLRTLFAKYGVVVIPRMQHSNKMTRTPVESKYGKKGEAVLVDMSFTIVNADAPDDKFTVTWTGEAIGYDDKTTNKAATSAIKYYLMRQFNISEKGEDPDAESPEPAAGKTKPSVGSVNTASAAAANLRDSTPSVDELVVTHSDDEPVSKAQVAQISAYLQSQGIEQDDRGEYLKANFKVSNPKTKTRAEAEGILRDIKLRKSKAAKSGEASA